jgi:hypothetical protein
MFTLCSWLVIIILFYSKFKRFRYTIMPLSDRILAENERRAEETAETDNNQNNRNKGAHYDQV